MVGADIRTINALPEPAEPTPGALMGPHIIEGPHAHLSTLARWQPRLIVVLDPNPDEMRKLRQVCPDTVIIGHVLSRIM